MKNLASVCPVSLKPCNDNTLIIFHKTRMCATPLIVWDTHTKRWGSMTMMALGNSQISVRQSFQCWGPLLPGVEAPMFFENGGEKKVWIYRCSQSMIFVKGTIKDVIDWAIFCSNRSVTK